MLRAPFFLFVTVVAIGGSSLALGGLQAIPRWLLWTVTAGATFLAAHELLGRPLPILRWSFLRMLLSMKRLQRDWQVGDGREEGAARFVAAKAPPGDLDAAIRAIDEYARRKSFLINVGDEKGAILDAVVERVRPRVALELGAYVGYSALRIARKLPPGGRVVSVELSEANASIARRIAEHAGVADRIAFVTGNLGDGGKTMARLVGEHGLDARSVDVVFLDHDKDAYLPDLRRVLDAGWLHPGSVVVADNVRFPGAPEYRAHMVAQEGKRWRTRVHETHVEYQSLLPDIVLESTLL